MRGDLASLGYVGCFTFDTADGMNKGNRLVRLDESSYRRWQGINSLQECRKECYLSGSFYYGVKKTLKNWGADSDCWCGNGYKNTNDPSKELDVTRCASPCVNSMIVKDKQCGSPTEPNLAVYKINPDVIKADGYIGCYQDSSKRDLNDYVGSNQTPDTCRAQCRSRGKVYFSMQAGGQCFCGEKYGAPTSTFPKRPDNECLGQCGPNQEHDGYCGQNWRNAVHLTDWPPTQHASAD